MVDNLDGVNWNPESIRVADSGGGNSGQIVLANVTENRIPDWYYFDITGLLNGDTVDFFSTRGINGGATLGSLSFDSFVAPAAIPEPTSTALLGLGGLAFVLRRRR